MAAPTWVGVGGAVNSTTTGSYTLPAGWAQDDIFLMMVETSTETLTAPSGWAHITNSPITQSTGSTTKLNLLWRRATASETSPVVTVDPGDHQIGWIAAIRGCATSGNPWDSVTTSTGASTTSHSVSGVATTSPDTLYMVLIANGEDTQTTAYFNNNWSATGVTLTDRIELQGAAGNGGGIVGATGPITTPSTPGAATITCNTTACTTARAVITWRAASAAVTSSDTGSGADNQSVYYGKTGAQVDTFPSLNTGLWSANYGTPTVTSNQLVLNCVSSYEGVLTGLPYDLTDSQMVLQTVQVPTGGNGTRQAYMRAVLDANNNVEMLVDNGTLYVRKEEGGSVTTIQTVGAYNSTTHKWWRIKSDDVAGTDTVTFWTSPDGASWTQHGIGASTSFSQSALFMEIGSGYYGTETSPPDFIVDDFNNGAVAVSDSDTGSASEGQQLGVSSADHAGISSIIGVYKGYGTAAITAVGTHETLVGRNMQMGNDYLFHTGWAAFNYSDMRSQQLDPWRTWRDTRPGSEFVYGIPLLTDGNPGDFAGVVAGTYDTHFQDAADALVDSGNGDAIIRLGWEPNNATIGSWQATSNPSGYISAYQHVVDLFRATPGSSFKFLVSSAIGPSGSIDAFLDYYPGDAYVDYLGMNIYDVWWDTPATPEARWDHILNSTMGLAAHTTFAQSRGKPIVFDEWGLYTAGVDQYNGGGDNPYFINKMADYFIEVNPYYQSYFDSDWGGGVLADFTNGEDTYQDRFRTAGTVEASSTSVGIQDGDTGTGTEGTPAISAALADTDTGAGAEASSLANTLSSADTGSGADAESVAATLSSADTGTGAEAETIGLSDSDAGSGADAQSLAVTLTDGDTGASAEGTPSVGLSESDTGSGAETSSLAVTLSDAETGTGVDDQSLAVSLTEGDTGSGADDQSLAVALSDTDTGAGAEDGSVEVEDVTVQKEDDDTATGVETESLAVQVSDSDTFTGVEGDPTVALTEADTGSSDEASSIAATLADADTGSGVDTESIAATLSESDTGSGTDAESLAVAVSDSETGSAVEDSTIAATVSDGDTGVGEDDGSPDLSELLKSNGDTMSATETESVEATLADADTGGSTESESVLAQVTDTDSGSAEETSSLAGTVADNDTGQGVETQSLAAQLSDADTGTGTEGTPSVAFSATETTTAAETESVAATLADSDTGNLQEAEALAAQVTDSDTFSGVEASTGTATLSDTETGALVDDGFITSPVLEADSGSSVENESLTAQIPAADSGSAVEGESIIVYISDSDSVSAVENDGDVQRVQAVKQDGDTYSAAESESVVVYVYDSDTFTGVDESHMEFTVTTATLQTTDGWSAALDRGSQWVATLDLLDYWSSILDTE